MSPSSIPDAEQLAEFRRAGVLRLEGLIPAAAASRAREAVLGPLAALGLWRDGRWRLGEGAQRVKPSRDIGHRRPEIEALIDEPAVIAAARRLAGEAAFDRSLYPRPQVLFTLPDGQRPTAPLGWHTDLPRLASAAMPGLQLFTFLDAVEPQGGGPLVVAGSHRLLNEGRNLRVNEIKARLQKEPFFRELFSDASGATDLPSGMVGDVPVRIVELTGRPGDVWFTDLRLLHTAAPNVSDRPRMMVTHRFVGADRLPEISAAFGWR